LGIGGLDPADERAADRLPHFVLDLEDFSDPAVEPIGPGKFRQNAVAGSLYDPPAMFGYLDADRILQQLLECGERSRFIPLHQAAVTRDIGGQDGGEATLDALFGHSRRLPSEIAVRPIVLAPGRRVYQA